MVAASAYTRTRGSFPEGRKSSHDFIVKFEAQAIHMAYRHGHPPRHYGRVQPRQHGSEHLDHLLINPEVASCIVKSSITRFKLVDKLPRVFPVSAIASHISRLPEPVSLRNMVRESHPTGFSSAQQNIPLSHLSIYIS